MPFAQYFTVATKKELFPPMTANNLQPNSLSLWKETLMAVGPSPTCPESTCVAMSQARWALREGLINMWASSVSNVILSPDKP